MKAIKKYINNVKEARFGVADKFPTFHCPVNPNLLHQIFFVGVGGGGRGG